MITLDTTNLHKVDSVNGITLQELQVSSSEIESDLAKIKSRGQGFYEILDNQNLLHEITEYAQKVQGKYKYIVVLGIGGSALGTITLQKSLMHEFTCQLCTSPQLFVLDNIDPDYLHEAEQVISLPETLFIVVSKSGNTIETLSQYFYFRQKLEEQNLNLSEHFVFITDPKVGLLREISNSENIPAFEVPENVGGRFSVLTAVSLLPAALIGLNIHALIDGAKQARETFYNTNIEANTAYKIAKIQHSLYLKGKHINIMIPYSSKLAPINEWYSQLLAESIGKDGIGITPVGAKGVTDQHSQNQLYHDGPNDKLIMFLEILDFKNHIKIPNYYAEHPAVNFLKNSSFNELIALEAQGTKDSLTSQNRPNLSLQIPALNENTIGYLFFMFEASIAFLGEMFNVNAYDQPGVELSKKLTKQYYERKA